MLAVATFDTVWASIHRTFWDTTFGGVDWVALRDSLRPEAAQARSPEELRALLQAMVARLGQSHFALIPADLDRALGTGDEGGAESGVLADAGFDVALVDGRFLVTRVRAGGAADVAGVRPGWVLEGVGEIRARETVARLKQLPTVTSPRMVAAYAAMMVDDALEGAEGDTVRASFVDGNGRSADRALVLRPAPGSAVRFGNLPEMRVELERERVRVGGAEVGVIRFNAWMPVLAGELDRAVEAFRDLSGIVVDLRGNPGGVGFMAAGMAGHFIDARDTLGTMIMREDTLRFVINPRRVSPTGAPVHPFAGPVAIVTDAASVSTSEFFAGGMQALGRARVFGDTTAGQALPAVARRLPNGDVLMHAIADFVGPGGVRWEGRGVIPDVVVRPTREALLDGRDPALDAAVAWVVGEAKDSGQPR